MTQLDLSGTTLFDHVHKGPNAVSAAKIPFERLWHMGRPAWRRSLSTEIKKSLRFLLQRVGLSFGLTTAADPLACTLQAGNKSLISYNGQVGIPGYTGYIPTNASLGLPVKGFAHTGRPADPAVIDKLAQQTVDPRKTSQ